MPEWLPLIETLAENQQLCTRFTYLSVTGHVTCKQWHMSYLIDWIITFEYFGHWMWQSESWTIWRFANIASSKIPDHECGWWGVRDLDPFHYLVFQTRSTDLQWVCASCSAVLSPSRTENGWFMLPFGSTRSFFGDWPVMFMLGTSEAPLPAFS